MRQRDIVLVCVLLAVIVLGMFTYTYLERNQMPVEPAPVVETPTTEVPAYMSRIEAKHFFTDGVHTIVGEVMMPTPCDLLTYEATVAESFPEQITYNFGVINNSELCAQVVTPQRFLITASASAEATHRATFNGQSIELNLIEAAPNETPDSFELYFKG
jgi:hypothetical protein